MFTFQRTTLCALYFLILCNSSCANLQEQHSRVKRKVAFSKSSKIFFRLNGKDNLLNHTEIFAHGWAIRINFDLPDSVSKRYKFFKRDIHNEIEDMPYNNLALTGVSCLLKRVCQLVAGIKLSTNCGILCEIGKIISRTPGIEADFFRSLVDKCDYHSNTCPYSFKDTSIYNYG